MHSFLLILLVLYILKSKNIRRDKITIIFINIILIAIFYKEYNIPSLSSHIYLYSIWFYKHFETFFFFLLIKKEEEEHFKAFVAPRVAAFIVLL